MSFEPSGAKYSYSLFNERRGPFWESQHQWTVWMFKTTDWNGLWWIANATYLSGGFSYSWADNDPLAVYLNWTPVPARRTPAERLAVQARARPTIKRPT